MWISVHARVVGPKLRNLSKEIGCSQKEALGILVSLWLWGINNADKSGELVNADRRDVADALSTGLSDGLAPMNIVESLINVNWIDEVGGTLYLHDWDTWQEQWYKFLSRKEYDAERKRKERGRGKSAQPEDGDDADRLEKTDAPADKEEDSPADSPEETKKPSKYSTLFEDFWSIYPRKIEKGNAYKKWSARLMDGYAEEELISAARAYAAQCLSDRTEERFIKHPKTFLSDALPFLDFMPKKYEEIEGSGEDGNPFEDWKGDT